MEKNKIPESYKNKHGNSIMTVKAIEDDSDEFVLNFVGSSETPDRAGDVVESSSWRLESYLKNPVFLWGHQHRDLPIGKALDVKVNPEKKSLEFKIKFAVEEYPFAKTVYKLYKNGFLSATSVGFIPNDFDYDEDKDVFILKDNELLELSAVTVPANPDALIQGFNKGLIDTGDIEGMKEQGMLNKIKEDMSEQEVEKFEETVEEDEEETDSEKDEVVDTTTGDESNEETEETSTETEETEKGEEETEETETLDADEEEDVTVEQDQEETEVETEDDEEKDYKVKVNNMFKELGEEIETIKSLLVEINDTLKAQAETVTEETQEETTSDKDEETETEETQETEKTEPTEETEVEEEEKSEEPQVITFAQLKEIWSGTDKK